jgi:hypothetical protein
MWMAKFPGMEQAAPKAGRCVHLFAFERSPVERSYKMIFSQPAPGWPLSNNRICSDVFALGAGFPARAIIISELLVISSCPT